LLVRAEDGNRIALLRVHLVADAVHVGAHALAQLPARGRVAARPLIRSETHAGGIHRCPHGATTRLGATRDRREPDDLLIRELKLTRVREKQLRGGNAPHRPVRPIRQGLRRQGWRGDDGEQYGETNIWHATLSECV
jgi:hypothetical protein